MPTDTLVDVEVMVTCTNVRRSLCDDLKREIANAMTGTARLYDSAKVDIHSIIGSPDYSEVNKVAGLEKTLGQMTNDCAATLIDNDKLRRELEATKIKLEALKIKATSVKDEVDHRRYGVPECLNPGGHEKESPTPEDDHSGAVVDKENEEKIIAYLLKKPERNLGHIAMGIKSTRNRCKRLVQGMVDDGRLKVIVKGEDENTESVYVVSDTLPLAAAQESPEEPGTELNIRWGDEAENETKDRIKEFLKEHPKSNFTQVSDALSLSYTVAGRLLRVMTENGDIVKNDGGKGFSVSMPDTVDQQLPSLPIPPEPAKTSPVIQSSPGAQALKEVGEKGLARMGKIKDFLAKNPHGVMRRRIGGELGIDPNMVRRDLEELVERKEILLVGYTYYPAGASS